MMLEPKFLIWRMVVINNGINNSEDKSAGIIDEFGSDHGLRVENTFDVWYNGNITQQDISGFPVSSREVKQLARDMLPDHYWGNLSIWFGDTLDPYGATERQYGWHNTMRDYWESDALFTVAAGNLGVTEVNIHAATPFNIGVGALKGGEVAEFSSGHPKLTMAWANGDVSGGRGTSFSAPRVGGAMAEIKETLDLTNPEVITAYEQTAYPVKTDDGIVQALDALELVSLDSAFAIEDQVIVDGAYRTLLGRQPGDGSSFWDEEDISTVVEAGKENNDFNQDLVPVHQRVKGLYNTFLEREPDLDEMAQWMMEAQGNTWQDLTRDFVNAAEERGETIYHQKALNAFLTAPEEDVAFG